MSLQFGLYLVEQGIISCDQFCGLVKIQQMAMPSLSSIAIKKNVMSIKQVAQVLDQVELRTPKSFLDIARKLDFIDEADQVFLLREQQMAVPSLQKLVVECGLMTARQAAVLQRAFEKSKSEAVVPTGSPVAPPASPTPRHETIRQPKFKQRPVVVQQYELS